MANWSWSSIFTESKTLKTVISSRTVEFIGIYSHPDNKILDGAGVITHGCMCCSTFRKNRELCLFFVRRGEKTTMAERCMNEGVLRQLHTEGGEHLQTDLLK